MDIKVGKDTTLFEKEDANKVEDNFACLFCSKLSKNCCIGGNCNDPIENSMDSYDNYILSKQLEVIFVLRNLLEVPSTKLECYLKKFSDKNPEEWISLCENCKKLVDQARELHFQIVEIKRIAKGIQREIIDKIKQSSPKVNYWNSECEQDADEQGSLGSLQKSKPSHVARIHKKIIWKEVRELVKGLEFGSLQDSFVGGDRLAKELAQRNVGTSTTTTTLIVFDKDAEALEVSASQIVKQEAEENIAEDWDDNFVPLSPLSTTATQDTCEERGMLGDEAKKGGLPRGNKRKLKKRKCTPVKAKKKEYPVKYRCPECEKPFYFGQQYHRHLRSAHNITRVPCLVEGCGKSFTDVDGYKRHTASHSDTLDFSCELCGKAFRTKDSVRIHRRNLHPASRGNFTCTICNKVLASPNTLLVHKRRLHNIGADGTHIPEKKVVCHICGERMHHYTLKRHIQNVHESKFKVTCELCGLEFKGTSAGALKRHILTKHKEQATQQLGDNIQMFTCPVNACRRFFYSKKTFDEHMEKIHKGKEGEEAERDERFKCALCGKGFFIMAKLTHHELAHKNEGTTPYTCDICRKGFTTPLYLRRHRLLMHQKRKGKKGGVEKTSDVTTKTE